MLLTNIRDNKLEKISKRLTRGTASIPCILNSELGYIVRINDYLVSVYFRRIERTGGVFKRYKNKMQTYKNGEKPIYLKIEGFTHKNPSNAIGIEKKSGKIAAVWVPKMEFILDYRLAKIRSSNDTYNNFLIQMEWAKTNIENSKKIAA